MTRFEGGCLCGSVRYVAVGEPINQRVCHCRLCQRAVGASFNARLLFRVGNVSVEGAVSTFPSSPDLRRGFCGRCGTTVFSARVNAGLIGLTAGSLDDPAQFKPAAHIFTATRQPWLALDDGLPQHSDAAPV